MNQNWDSVEHIIIDGGSTDNTIDILKKYPHLIWISEPDEGQSDALNKGLKRATGEIIGWINSDDYYEENIFEEVVAAFNEAPVNWVIGNVTSIYPSLGIAKPLISPDIEYENLLKNPNITRQSPAFFKKDALIATRGWNKKYHMAMDFDLWVRLSKTGPPKMVKRNWAFTTHHDRQKTSPENTLGQISDIVDILKKENLSWIKIQRVVSKKYGYLLKEKVKKYYHRPV